MRVVWLYPPNFRKIQEKFKVRGTGVIFTFGKTIYNPDRVILSKALHAHEEVHMYQQGDDPWTWWEHYMEDPAFRLSQEIPAHKAEYLAKVGTDELYNIATRLSGPLYGNLISFGRAKAILEHAYMERQIGTDYAITQTL